LAQTITESKREKTMGLFDFAKDIGKKLFGHEAEASDKIKEEIEHDNPGISDLTVSYQDGVVSLSGKADSAEAMEKAVLMAGNVKGVAEVKAEQIESPPQTDQVEFYVIQKGDTLSAVAKRFYGDASAYPRIFKSNREVIKDPDLIFPGQKIRIPASDA
jgi:LysM repeat protein